jgi:fructose transport system substrate-binding protein
MSRPASVATTGHSSGRGRLLRATVVLVGVMVFLAACGGSSNNSSSSSSSGGGKGFTAGLITKTDTNPFFVKMKEGATKEANAKGGKLLTAAGKFDGDNASQVTAIENMVAGGAKGILITPSDTKAIVPAVAKARAKGVVVIALDTPTDPQSAVNALFATNNFTAGQLIGKYAKATFGSKPAKIATLDLAPGITVGVLRHNGFLNGFGLTTAGPTTTQLVSAPEVVCSNDTQGDQAKGQTAMENCLQKSPDINLVYTINEPAALGAYTALKNAGKEKNVLMVSVDGGCTGVKAIQDGKIAATSQQYPLKMASQGIDAIAKFAQTGTKPSGYTDTGVTLITNKPVSGVPSKDVQFGLANCWG